MPMLYDLTNPSDACTFLAPNVAVATLVAVLLGGGQYGATLVSGEGEDGTPGKDVPFFMFGGLEEWWGEHGDGQPLEGAADRAGTPLVEALRSVCYGDAETRRLFDSALVAIDDPVKRAGFVAEWNDARRSSMNNIMGRAHAMADGFAERLAAA